MRLRAEFPDDPLRLWRFLRLIAVAASLLSASYLVVAAVLSSGALYGASAIVAGLAAAVALAAKRARGGHVVTSALVTSYALLVAVVLVTPLVAFAYATLVLTCTFAATVAIAFVEPRHTRAVILASMAVALYTSLVGLWLGPRTTLPSWARDSLVVLTVLVHVYLISYAMLQLRDSLTGMLRARQRASAELESAHRTLACAYERARAADRRKDDFLAMLGHELRNPLAPIGLALELMRETCDGLAVREREIIERQVRHMARLVDDLLDISRVTSGKLTVKPRPMELGSIVQEAVEMTRPLLASREQALVVDVPDRGLLVDADPTRLSQVVSNLLANASKYTPAKGHISLRAEPVGGDARVVVEDDGMGMTPELLAHVFEAFVQGPAGVDRGAGGLGLGLALARSLVELHGGRIEAASEGLGRGSRFTVTLPLAARAEVEPAEPERAPSAPPRVLVVDDNEDAADLLALALSRRGFDVRVAHDGPEALRVASELHPEVAVLDIGLPRMDGYELAERMREELPEQPLRLIALTGYGQPSDRARSAEAGFAAHLVKPVDLAQLERCLA